MAKECLKNKQAKLKAQWDAHMVEVRKAMELPADKREEALEALKAKRVKNRLFKTKVYNRCAMTGRSKGYIRYFGVCRHSFREMAHKGELPGVKKSSW
jgi:small subunit ribosomal protein S14